MEFVTIADLNNDVINNLYKIPRDVDLIVGIPRSGLFVASIIALYLNKPLTDIDSFVENKIYNVGNTKNNNSNIKEANEAKKILVVDDSLNSGLSMEQARLKLKKFEENKKILYLAGYIKSAKKNSIDIFFRVINDNRLFEWNYMHHTMLEEVCCDIDGVLCENPSDEENDDGEKYINFILNAKPKLVPTRGIGCLVTSRLEKYRKETEIWLKNNHIIYNKLVMMGNITSEERKKLGNHGKFKANFYKTSRYKLFIESDVKQALEISNLTQKYVFCIDNQKFYRANSIYHMQEYVKYISKNRIKYILKKILPKFLIEAYKKDSLF